MKQGSLLQRIDYFYSLAVPLAERRVTNKTAVMYSTKGDTFINVYDQAGKLKSSLGVTKYNGLIDNPFLTGTPLYEMTSIVSTSPLDTLLNIVLCWKALGPIVPDQFSVSSPAVALIKNYYKKYGSDPKLVRPLITYDYDINNPLKYAYLPNSSLFGLASDISIQHITNPAEVAKLSNKADDLFETKYNEQRIKDKGNNPITPVIKHQIVIEDDEEDLTPTGHNVNQQIT